MLKRWVLTIGCLLILTGIGVTVGEAKSKAKAIDVTKPRMVMVEIPSWKTVFFGLPKELPLMIRPGEPFDGSSRQYDFSEGTEAMRIFLSMRPQAKHAVAYRCFIKKWPRYQEFFKAVDQEDYALAEKQLMEIRTLDPKEPAVHFYYGSLNTHLKKYQQAEKSYQKCLVLYPKYGPAYINLARLAKARGDEPAAKRYLRTAIEKLDKSSQQDAKQIAEKMLKSLSGE
ncbi:hypothetical protein K8S19_00660 [bacterium]|nr:hypothetical protein [bacterium]